MKGALCSMKGCVVMYKWHCVMFEGRIVFYEVHSALWLTFRKAVVEFIPGAMILPNFNSTINMLTSHVAILHVNSNVI